VLIKLFTFNVASLFFIIDLNNVIVIIIINNTLINTAINILLSDHLNATLNTLSIIQQITSCILLAEN